MFMCTGVSGDSREQECITLPATDDPHFVEHPTRDMRYGKHIIIHTTRTLPVNSLQVSPHRLIQYKMQVKRW